MRENGKTYRYRQPGQKNLEAQRAADGYPYRFSILVPAYETKEAYLREMIDSVLGQSYGNLELIIADASRSKQVETVVRTYADSRLRYLPLKENKGIADNTNMALEKAGGDYVGLLDHDDVLTPDALYYMAKAISQKAREGSTAWLLYSDEDKGNGEMTEYYEPHFKPKLNVDLLLSNNYICHLFTVNRQIAIDAGAFVSEYNGAQDYDFILRCIEIIGEKGGKVEHVPKVLYHWRSHSLSTAERPESKMYAYEAGKKVLEAHLKRMGLHGKVSHGKHLGFYRIDYEEKEGEEGIFLVNPSCKPLSKGWEKEVKGYFSRPEVGAVGGKICDEKNRIQCAGYEKDENGKIQAPFRGMDRRFSGYLHRAAIQRDVEAVDMDCIIIRKELWEKLKESFQEREKNKKQPEIPFHLA